MDKLLALFYWVVLTVAVVLSVFVIGGAAALPFMIYFQHPIHEVAGLGLGVVVAGSLLALILMFTN